MLLTSSGDANGGGVMVASSSTSNAPFLPKLNHLSTTISNTNSAKTMFIGGGSDGHIDDDYGFDANWMVSGAPPSSPTHDAIIEISQPHAYKSSTGHSGALQAAAMECTHGMRCVGDTGPAVKSSGEINNILHATLLLDNSGLLLIVWHCG